jgi:hypothetical protein
MGEIVGGVEIERQVDVGADLERRPRTRAELGPELGRGLGIGQRLGKMPTERAAAVRCSKRRRGRERHHVRAVSSSIGHERDAMLSRHAGEVAGPRQIGVGNGDMREVEFGDLLDAVVDRTVEPEPAAPDDVGSLRLGPFGHLVVVARDERGMTAHGLEHTGGHPLREPRAICRLERAPKAALGGSEPLHRNENGDLHSCGLYRRHTWSHEVRATHLLRYRGVMRVPEQIVTPTGDSIAGVRDGITTGVTGQTWRATVTPWGDIEPWGGVRRPVRWFVAADDRWHAPADETAVRQRRIAGTPVVETRVRVPDGDAVQRIWSVADRGGLTVIEIENDSSRPFAVALTGGDVLTERPPADLAIQGIELPADAIVVPIGHRSTVRVAIAHDASAGHRSAGLRPLPDRLASADSVASGWTTVCERASRLVLPDASLTEAVTVARCDLLLDGPVDSESEPLGFLFDVAHLARLGDDAERWLLEVLDPVARVARIADPRVDDALDGLERVAVMAGDDRAARDIAALRIRRRTDGLGRQQSTIDSWPVLPGAASSRPLGEFLDSVERSLVSGADLLRSGVPSSWLGSNFEVHGLPTSARSTVSFAVRWHGDRPAVLWEQSGAPVTLTAQSIDAHWSSSQVQGEALWPAPETATTRAAASPMSSDEPISFG